MALDLREGLVEADRTNLTEIMTNAMLAVRLAVEEESEAVLTNYLKNHLNHDNSLCRSVVITLLNATNIFDSFTVIAEMIGIAE